MRGKGKSAELARWLQEHHPPQIGEAEFPAQGTGA
jgi:hypothetical protein